MDSPSLLKRLSAVTELLEQHIEEYQLSVSSFASGYQRALADVGIVMRGGDPEDRWGYWRYVALNERRLAKHPGIPSLEPMKEPGPTLVHSSDNAISASHHTGGYNGVDMYEIEPDPTDSESFRVVFLIDDLDSLTGFPNVVEANIAARRKLKAHKLIPERAKQKS